MEPSENLLNVSKTLEYLPTEILAEILLYLPVKSLWISRRVCKTWGSLISSSQFAKAHLNFSRNSNNYANHGLILQPLKDPGYTYTCSLSSILDSTACVYPKRLSQSRTSLSVSSIYGNRNGLFLRANSKLAFPYTVLYNPVTQKLKKLPHSGTSKEVQFEYRMTYGICYIELDDDYRVVEICIIQDCNRKKFIEVKIYSLRTNSWRKINDRFYCSNFISGGNHVNRNASVSGLPGVPFGGVLHWVVDDSSQILGVDTETYTYQTLEGPKYDNSVRCSSMSGIIDFGGCLGVYHCFHNTRVDIWTMKESWIKVLSMPYYLCPRVNNRPLVGLKDGKILFQNDDGYSSVYNSSESSFITHVIPDFRVPYEVSSPVYIESLIAPSFDGE